MSKIIRETDFPLDLGQSFPDCLAYFTAKDSRENATSIPSSPAHPPPLRRLWIIGLRSNLNIPLLAFTSWWEFRP